MEKFNYEKLYIRIFKISLIVLGITFITLYFSQITGYYEYELHKKVVFTEEQIKQFEKDVAEGKNIDIEEYLKDYDKDYQNSVSKAGLFLSEKIGTSVRSGIRYVFNTLNKLIDDDK